MKRALSIVEKSLHELHGTYYFEHPATRAAAGALNAVREELLAHAERREKLQEALQVLERYRGGDAERMRSLLQEFLHL